FLIEGDEETGSALLKNAILKNKKNLKCDCVIISDGGLIGDDSPAFEASFRGSSNIEVCLQTGKDDLHSGLFGGSVPNAAEELSLLISKLHDKNKRILIPGFYDRAKRQKIASGGNEISLKKLTGTKKVFVRNNGEFETRTGLEPAIEVTGFMSGYIDAGFRNSVPRKATAKINLRFAPEQDPKKMILLIKKFLINNTPKYVDIKITGTDSSPGANLDFDNEFAKRAEKILTYVYKKIPAIKHCGGTLPIVNDFKEILGVPQVMIPLANEDCGMHSASENISVTSVRNGLSFSEKMFSDFHIQ
ncbi:MAG: M20/M25/M40 family metallo-hydrolase, partial [Candidatus Andersenbacteria bacterium]